MAAVGYADGQQMAQQMASQSSAGLCSILSKHSCEEVGQAFKAFLTCVWPGQKHQLHWLDHYLVAASSQDTGSLGLSYTLQLYDLRNKLIAASIPLSEVSILLFLLMTQ